MAIPNQRSMRHDLIAGVLTSQIAGLMMAGAMMVVFTILGKGPLYPVQVIGSLVFGDAALVGFHLPAFLTGLVLHQAVASLLWGLVFALIANKLQPRHALVALAIGLAVGVVSELLDVGLIVPAVMNARFGHNIWAENVPRFWGWVAHLVFGVSFVVFPWVRNRLFRNSPV